MNHVRQLVDQGAERLGGGAQAIGEAGALLAHVLGKDRAWLYAWPEAQVNETHSVRFHDLIQKRAQGEPVAYLTGRRAFWSLSLAVDEHTLIPRPETEHLVEFILGRRPAARRTRLLDLGTGSGAIALALASERPGWDISATDRSRAALACARRNALEHGLKVNFVLADWLEGIGGDFDIIVSNPPYVAANDPHLALGDLRFEPRSALSSGDDGLDDIRAIVSQAREHLVPGGWLLVEHGFDQGDACQALLRQAGYLDVATGRDLAGQQRFSYARAGESATPLARPGCG